MIDSSPDHFQIEQDRRVLQDLLDSAKTQAERNRLGQYATPSELASDILKNTLPYINHLDVIRFLDPAFGTGSFFSALLRHLPLSRIESAKGFEIDPHYGMQAKKLWNETLLELDIEDFTRTSPPNSYANKANLLICNPPYVRHHHLSRGDKSHLQLKVGQNTNIRLSGLAGLYCYFLLIADAWLAKEGIGCWLIPSEFLDVNYGVAVKEYLLTHVTLLRVHHFNPEDVQFDDAMVSSVVVWFQKQIPCVDHSVEFSYGNTLSAPARTSSVAASEIQADVKWSAITTGRTISHRRSEHSRLTLSEIFDIRRGIATGANNFFIINDKDLDKWDIPAQFLVPILPSPRYLRDAEVFADEAGVPNLPQRLFLINCDLPEIVVRERFPILWRYYQMGVDRSIHERYLCRHRSPWYAQERRSPAPLLCTYMGRRISARNGSPFRFILNHSSAIAANVYLMLYPKSRIQSWISRDSINLRHLWSALKNISTDELIGEGRTYGGNLHKLEPKELARATVPDIFGEQDGIPYRYRQLSLLEKQSNYEYEQDPP